MDLHRISAAALGLCLVLPSIACRMDNPAFDAAEAGGSQASGDGDSNTTAPGDSDPNDTGSSETDTGDGDGDGDGDPNGGDGDGDFCIGLGLVGECPACIDDNCCFELDACLAEFGCTCLLQCLVLDGNAEGPCFSECQPDQLDTTLFQELIGCVGQICINVCGL